MAKAKKSKRSRRRRAARRRARISALYLARCNGARSPVPVEVESTRAVPTEILTIRIPPPQRNQEATAASAAVEPTQSYTSPVAGEEDEEEEEERMLKEYIREFYDDLPPESESVLPLTEGVDDDDELETHSPSPSPLDDGSYDGFPMRADVEYDGSWTDLPCLDYGSRQHEVDLATTLGLNCAYNDPSYVYSEPVEFNSE